MIKLLRYDEVLVTTGGGKCYCDGQYVFGYHPLQGDPASNAASCQGYCCRVYGARRYSYYRNDGTHWGEFSCPDASRHNEPYRGQREGGDGG